MVEKLLKERGIQKRTYVEAKQAMRKYNIDDNFFKNQSHEMAYIMGFLAADGNIAKNENGIFLEVHQHDEELLKQFCEITQSNRPLAYRVNNNGTPCVKMKVWSAAWKQDLAKYGIIPNKTFTLQSPSLLAPQYRMDYIRGYFDGDGSCYLCKGKVPYVQINSASKELIEWIRNEFAQIGVSTNDLTVNKLESGNNFYRLTYSRIGNIQKIYNAFYHENAKIFLKRKEKIMKIINSL